jgi:hypothetical protein
MNKPTNDYEALVLALTLAIRSETQEQTDQAEGMAEYFSERMELEDIERAVKHIEEVQYD